MRESVFITEVKRSIFAYGGWAYKLSDMPQSMIRGARFNPEKPFDLACCINGKFVGVECKQLKKYEAFGLRHIRETQIRGLDGILDGLGRAFVFVNIRQQADKKKGTSRLNRLIIFDWDVWRNRWKIGTSKKEEMLKMPFITGAKGYFPIDKWVLQF